MDGESNTVGKVAEGEKTHVVGTGSFSQNNQTLQKNQNTEPPKAPEPESVIEKRNIGNFLTDTIFNFGKNTVFKIGIVFLLVSAVALIFALIF